MQYTCIHGLSALACAKLHKFSKATHPFTIKMPPLTKFFFNGDIDYLPDNIFVFLAGSQVSPTPSFLNILWSTSPSITVECT